MSFLDGHFELRESQRLEFKEAAAGLPQDVWETYSAFANTEGGEIVLGVQEDRSANSFSLVGVSDAEGLADRVWTTARNSQVVEHDVLLPDSVSIVRRDGLEYVVISVPRAEREDKPVSVYDRTSKSFAAYVRRGTVDQKASRDDLDRMTYDRAPEADRRPLEDFSLDSLCKETVRRYRQVFSGSKPSSPWNSDSDGDFLYHIGATARGRDGQTHPTKAGLLAFGYEFEITRRFPQYLLDYREQTSGGTRWDDRVCSQSADWSGNVVDFYLTVIERLSRQFKAPFSAGASGVRHGSENPVTEAVNEAVANALVHAHYGSSASVKVVLSARELEVTNTGDFLIDRNVAIAGGFSETRNPTLMRMLSLIGATDRAGSGLQKIWSVWSERFGSEPVLEEHHSPAHVRLAMPLLRIASLRAQRAKYDDEIMELLAMRSRSEGVCVADVEGAVGISERVAQKALKSLFDRGVIVRERRGHQLRYCLPNTERTSNIRNQ